MIQLLHGIWVAQGLAPSAGSDADDDGDTWQRLVSTVSGGAWHGADTQYSFAE